MHKILLFVCSLSSLYAMDPSHNHPKKKLRDEFENLVRHERYMKDQIEKIPLFEEQIKLGSLVFFTFLGAQLVKMQHYIPKKLLENFSLNAGGMPGTLLTLGFIIYLYKLLASVLHADCIEKEEKMIKHQEQERKRLLERIDAYQKKKEEKLTAYEKKTHEWQAKFEHKTELWRNKNDEIIQSLKIEFDKVLQDFKVYKEKIEEQLEAKMKLDLSTLVRRLDAMQTLIGKASEIRYDIYQSLQENRQEIKKSLAEMEIGIHRFDEIIQPILRNIESIMQFLRAQNIKLRTLESAKHESYRSHSV